MGLLATLALVPAALFVEGVTRVRAPQLTAAGHVFGTVLLGIALLRTRRTACRSWWLVIIAQPLHFVAAVIVGSHSLDLVAWGANPVGFAAVSIATLRTSDQEWEPR